MSAFMKRVATTDDDKDLSFDVLGHVFPFAHLPPDLSNTLPDRLISALQA